MTKQERQARYRERRRIRLASPSAVALAADPSVPDQVLDTFHLAIRDRLRNYLADAGGADALAETKAAQIRSLVEAELVLEPMTRDVMALARGGLLWSMRTRRAAALLTDWLRLKTHRDGLLVAVGLTRQAPPAQTLDAICREIVAARPVGSTSPKEPAVADQAPTRPTETTEPAKAPRGLEGGDDAPVGTAARQVDVSVVEVRPARLSPEPLELPGEF